VSEGAVDTPRRVPVEPPVHVEPFASHVSLTWTVPPAAVERAERRAGTVASETATATPETRSLAVFLAAVATAAEVDGEDGTDAEAVVDDRATAGRERRPPSAVEPSETVRYVRVAGATWTAEWERRTTPVVSLSGAPTVATLRALHRATGGTGWDERAVAAAASVLAD
jgi:hypothetical protein